MCSKALDWKAVQADDAEHQTRFIVKSATNRRQDVRASPSRHVSSALVEVWMLQTSTSARLIQRMHITTIA